MKKIREYVSSIFIVSLLIPSTILVIKLSNFLYKETFKEWWVLILLCLLVPAIMIFIIMNRKR